MPRKSNNDGLDYAKYDSDYHQRAWEKFTQLTKEEIQNLKNRAEYFNQYKKDKGLV